MNADLVRALFAGWMAGAIAGMACTGAIMLFIGTNRAVAARVPWSSKLPVLGIVLANALTIGLTLVGLLLGVVFYRMGGEGLGTRFALYAFGGTVAVGALYVFVRRRFRTGEAPMVLFCLVVTGLCFGFVLPLLDSLAA